MLMVGPCVIHTENNDFFLIVVDYIFSTFSVLYLSV